MSDDDDEEKRRVYIVEEEPTRTYACSQSMQTGWIEGPSCGLHTTDPSDVKKIVTKPFSSSYPAWREVVSGLSVEGKITCSSFSSYSSVNTFARALQELFLLCLR